MSAITPTATDFCGAANGAMCQSRPMHRSKQRIQKDRFAAVSPKSDQVI